MLERRIVLPMRRLAMAAIVALVVLTSPAFALAAAGPWKSIDLTLVGSATGDQGLLVAGRLTDKASLPATVTLAVPPGAKIAWVGEILGGATANDPSVQYKDRPGKDYDLISFTLAQSRIGQVEVSAPGAYTANGGATKAAFSWTAPYSIPTANLRILMPSGAKVASGTAGGKIASTAAGALYQLIAKSVPKGKRLSLAVAFTGPVVSPGTASAAAQPQQTGAAPVSQTRASPTGLIVVVAVLLLVLTYFALKWFAHEPEVELDSLADEHEFVEADVDDPDFEVDEFVAEQPAHACGPSCACESDEPIVRALAGQSEEELAVESEAPEAVPDSQVPDSAGRVPSRGPSWARRRGRGPGQSSLRTEASSE
jgi:hypothetical protein